MRREAVLALIKHAENKAKRPAGTGHAILYESGAPSQHSPSPNTWGGPRNRASRESDCIKPIKAVELVEAAQRAIAIGLPFNRHLTVHWAKAKISDREAAAATGRIVKLIRDWARKKGGEVVYAWVRENGLGKGTHSHILLHIPEGLRMGLTRRWYRLATGLDGKVPRFAVRCDRIGGTTRGGFSASEWYQANLARLLAYVLKGTDQPTGAALGLDANRGDGGSIIGKRVSTSPALRKRGSV